MVERVTRVFDPSAVVQQHLSERFGEPVLAATELLLAVVAPMASL